MLLSDFGGIALITAAAALAGVMMWRRSGRGACEGCKYDLRGLPTEVACCPECGRERAKAKSRWRRLGKLWVAGIALVVLFGAGMIAWPRRESIMERMPSQVLLFVERFGYHRGLELVTMRAHEGQLSKWTEGVFIDRVTERLIEDSVRVTWPKSNALYVYTQLAMVEVEPARDGLKRVFRNASASTVDDVVKTLAFIRMDAPDAMIRESLKNKLIVQEFLKTDRGRLYTLMMNDPAWLEGTLLEMLDAAKTDGEAVGVIMLIKQVFRDVKFAEGVVTRIEKAGKWTAALTAAQGWVTELKAPPNPYDGFFTPPRVARPAGSVDFYFDVPASSPSAPP